MARSVRRVGAVSQVALLAALAAACAATRASVTPFTDAPGAGVAPEAVEVITREPDGEFQELGMIEVTGNIVAGYDALVARARLEAAKLGADVVLISREPLRGANITPAGGSAVATGTEVPRVWALALRRR